MSVPRFALTVALTPCPANQSRKAATPAAGVPRPAYPGVGLSGMMLTWAASGSASSASSAASRGCVVHAVDQSPLERKPPALGGQVLGARPHQHRQGGSGG